VSDLFNRAKALFGRSEPEAKPAPVKKKPINPWHAVSIVPGPRACAAALELRDQRFLSRSAPTLPLKKCDNPACTCRYEHYVDRRGAPRRAFDLGASIAGYDGPEHRAKTRRGRRKTDE